MTFIAEDSEVVLDALIRALETLAHARVVGTAGSAAAAIDWLRSNAEDWDLAVLDLHLHTGTGLDILASLRDRLPRQRVAVLAIGLTAFLREECLVLGADAVFDKSTELDSFMMFCDETWKADKAGSPLFADQVVPVPEILK